MHSAPFGISLGRSGNGLQYEVLFLNRMHDGMMESYTLLDCFSKTWSYAPKLQCFLFLSIFRVRGGGHGPRHPCLSTVVAIQEFNHLIRDPAESCAS